MDWAAVLVLLVCFIASTGYKGGAFMSGNNMVNILRVMTINTVSGTTATITMALDGFDMSAGTLASCSAHVFVSACLWFGMSLGISIIACIFAILVMYQLITFLILVRKIPDMLATYALMFVHQGIGQWYIGGDAASTGIKTSWGVMSARTALSESSSAIGRAPWIVITTLGCVFAAHLFPNSTGHGRYLYAIDGNKEAVKLPGIDVKKHRYPAGMITAAFIAVGGILVASRGSSAQTICCGNYLTSSPAVVFVGCTVGDAEKPNALGTMISAMLVSTLENGLTTRAAPLYVLPAVKGAVLALALIAVYASKREG